MVGMAYVHRHELCVLPLVIVIYGLVYVLCICDRAWIICVGCVFGVGHECAWVIPLGWIGVLMVHPLGENWGCWRYTKLSRCLCGGWTLEMSLRCVMSSL